jgi:lysophospholipase L1-like esterase
MMRPKLALVAALALSLAAVAPAAARAAKPSPKYYVALGDSLSVGVQPLASGKSVETRQGYVDQLYALKRRSIRGLRLHKLGCGGETTSSMLGTGPKSFCQYAGDRRIGYSKQRHGSQLGAAETFLRRHRGQIAFVTIDIGANNVDSCAKGGNVNFTCLNDGIASIKNDVPLISRRLRAAAGRSVPIVGMTLYDPFLEFYFNPSTRGLAGGSVTLAKSVDTAISDAHKRNGVGRVADVFSAFRTTDQTLVTYSGPLTNNRAQRTPRDVERICRLTWMCASRPQGPNIHANQAGYGVIARTFKPLV